MNPRCLCFLFVVLKAVDCLEVVNLPHVDFYMLCSNDIREMNPILELDGFYTDLLPSASEISVEEDPLEFYNCTADGNLTQVKFFADGIAEFSADNLLTEHEIQKLVTSEKLEKFIGAKYQKCDVFEAIVSPRGTAPHPTLTGAWAQLMCDMNYTEFLVQSMETMVIVSIVTSIILALCLVACICACCGACG